MAMQRILLKISGEALMGKGQYGIDPETVSAICKAVKATQDLGVQIAIVVGGGNIFRGIKGAQMGIPEATAHHMGILATVMNGLALRECFNSIGAKAVAFSSLPLDSLCPTYARWRAIEALERGEIVIATGGTGNPFFTTDTGAVLRAIELECDAALKATQVDGVYDKDPNQHSDAKRYSDISYAQILQDDLKVMDSTAIALARDNALPLVIFSLSEPQNMVQVVQGKGLFTRVEA